MELEIECLWHTDKTSENDKLEIDSSVEDYENRTMTFYSIDAVSPSKGWDDEIERCKIYCSGDTFISCYSYEETKNLISAAKKVTN